MCRNGLLKDAERISDKDLKDGYLNKSLHKNMLNEVAVPFEMKVIKEDNNLDQIESKKIVINTNKNNDFNKYCYELTNNSNYNFCPNCGNDNTNYDFKFCADCGTSLNRK